MPCPCCGQRLPGDPTKAEQAKIDSEVRQRHHYHTNYWMALGLRAEGVPEKQIGKIRSLSAGMSIWARRRQRGISGHTYAPGMVQQWGRTRVITPR